MARSQPVIVLVTAHAPPEGLHPGLLGFFTAQRALPGCLQKGPASGATQQTPRHNVILLEDDLPEADPLPALHSTWAGPPGTPLPFLRFAIATHFAECRTVDNVLQRQKQLYNAWTRLTGVHCAGAPAASCPGTRQGPLPESCAGASQSMQGEPPTQPLPVIHARSRPNAAELERQRALQKKVGCSCQP